MPSMVYSDRIKQVVQDEFKGLDHNLGAKDGSLWDMRNLTGDYWPLLSVRRPRAKYKTLTEPGGLFAWEKLCWVTGTEFWYGGEKKGTVTAGKKSFAALGAYIIILPDKAYYNVVEDEFGSMEAAWSGESLTFTNGLLFEEKAEANAIQAEGVEWADYFRAGDAVTIEGCTKHQENNKTPVIREIDGDKLYFYEYAFTLDGEDGTEPYAEHGTLSIKRKVPDLLFLCENENRLWGCDKTTIYASKPGDIFNWNVFEGLDSDSYAVDTGSAGSFTACVSYLGYPIFFKEDHIYKVYGSLPSNFQLMGSATLGVAEGSAGSLAVAGEMLFYLSRSGFMAYSGGIPQPVGKAFGMERYRNAVGGSDGLKYHVSVQREDGSWLLHVYDAQSGMWHTEDETHATHWARWDGELYFLTEAGEIWTCGGSREPQEGAEPEKQVDWWVEFGDFTDGSANKKGAARLQIRLELEEGASVRAYLQFDSDQIWRPAGSAMGEGAKRSYILPIVPRRADHYRLKLVGAGGCRVWSIARELYAGSALRSKTGRN